MAGTGAGVMDKLRFLPFAGITRIRFEGLTRQTAKSQPYAGLPQEQPQRLRHHVVVCQWPPFSWYGCSLQLREFMP